MNTYFANRFLLASANGGRKEVSARFALIFRLDGLYYVVLSHLHDATIQLTQ